MTKTPEKAIEPAAADPAKELDELVERVKKAQKIFAMKS